MRKNRTTKRKIVLRIILIVLTAIVLLSAVIIGMCLFNERSAVQTLADYRSAFGGTTIDVSDDGGVTILPQNGSEKHTGIIFYVGAQIEPSAYIPTLARIAEAGYPCFIPKLT